VSGTRVVKDPEFREGLQERILESPPTGLSEEEAAATTDSYLDAMDRWRTIITDDLGYDFPDAPEDFDSEALDLQPWLDRVWSDILEPRRPA
jgi:hypothetical protein